MMWIIDAAIFLVIALACYVCIDVLLTNRHTRKVNDGINSLREQYQSELHKDS